MPIVCITRPNRKKRRRYRPSDVARIAGYAYESAKDSGEGLTDEEVLAQILRGIAERLGVLEVFCAIALVLTFVGQLGNTLSAVQDGRVWQDAERTIRKWRRRLGLLKRIPGLGRVVRFIDLVFSVLERLSRRMNTLSDTVEQAGRLFSLICIGVLDE